MAKSRSSAAPFSRANLDSWAIDLIRIAWGLIAWNARKTKFRLGLSRRCPCQAPSDSGIAGETRCEASFLLDRPTRFQFVCPALRNTPAGWRCHHDRATVRPYWGRCILTYATLALLLWVTGATLWFGSLRIGGVHRVAWLDCVWPPRHERVGEARAEHFRNQFQHAISEGNIPAAIVALHSAFVSCDTCWRDGLVLAQIYERTGQFAAADHIFDQAEQRAPDHHTTITVARHDALLHSRRFRSLAELAWREFQHATNDRETWLVPLAHALAADPLAVKVLPPTDERNDLTSGERALLELAANHQRPLPAFIRNQIITTPANNPTQAILRWRLLLDQGDRLAALQAINRDTATLSRFELELARWATIDPRTSAAQAAQWWLDLIPLDPAPAHIARLVAVALRSPFQVPLAALRVRLPDDDRASLAALWVLAVRQGDANLATDLLKDMGYFPEANALPLDPNALAARLPITATLLPIPREVLYALMPSPGQAGAAATVDQILQGSE